MRIAYSSIDVFKKKATLLRRLAGLDSHTEALDVLAVISGYTDYHEVRGSDLTRGGTPAQAYVSERISLTRPELGSQRSSGIAAVLRLHMGSGHDLLEQIAFDLGDISKFFDGATRTFTPRYWAEMSDLSQKLAALNCAPNGYTPSGQAGAWETEPFTCVVERLCQLSPDAAAHAQRSLGGAVHSLGKFLPFNSAFVGISLATGDSAYAEEVRLHAARVLIEWVDNLMKEAVPLPVETIIEFADVASPLAWAFGQAGNYTHQHVVLNLFSKLFSVPARGESEKTALRRMEGFYVSSEQTAIAALAARNYDATLEALMRIAPECRLLAGRPMALAAIALAELDRVEEANELILYFYNAPKFLLTLGLPRKRASKPCYTGYIESIGVDDANYGLPYFLKCIDVRKYPKARALIENFVPPRTRDLPTDSA